MDPMGMLILNDLLILIWESQPYHWHPGRGATPQLLFGSYNDTCGFGMVFLGEMTWDFPKKKKAENDLGTLEMEQ